MIEFGRTLRAAREAKGYTIAQVAELTHMSPATVENLEKEDFTRISAPIFGRGFVKLYCEAVGLDPKPMVAEFMDIFNGNHDTSIKERPIIRPSAAPEPPAEPEPPAPPVEPDLPVQTPAPVEAPEPPPAPAPEPDLFAQPPPEPNPVAAPETPPPSAAPTIDDLFPVQDQPAPEPPRLSRYAAPISQSQMREPAARFPDPAVWRILALVCAAIVLIWLAFLGVRALYRATSTPADPETPATTLTAEEATARNKVKDEAKAKDNKGAKPVDGTKAAPSAAPRKPQDIPALYID